jgi:hypothetical protein
MKVSRAPVHSRALDLNNIYNQTSWIKDIVFLPVRLSFKTLAVQCGNYWRTECDIYARSYNRSPFVYT